MSDEQSTLRTAAEELRGTGEVRRKRGRSRALDARSAAGVSEEMTDLVRSLMQDLSDARRQIDELRRDLDAEKELRLEETRELGQMRRQRDGLQFRTDYLEEKLDMARREIAWRRLPWWKRGRSAPSGT